MEITPWRLQICFGLDFLLFVLGYMVDYDSIMKGTKFGPVVVPKSGISSTLYLVIANKTSPEIQMPPHHENSLAEGRGTPLTGDQIEVIGKWIDQGALIN